MKKKYILIAEVKIKSPSEGVLGRLDDVEEYARDYEQGGADMISAVIDGKRFAGNINMIGRIKNATDLPIFAKDFITEKKRLVDIKKQGASAVLLLAMSVSKKKLKELYRKTKELNMAPVVEVDNEADLRSAIEEKFETIAVNARNLRDLSVGRERAIYLIKKIPKGIIPLAFSGVRNRSDLQNYLNAGAKGILIGTMFMRAADKINMLRKYKNI